jgi:hypothetical protein
MNIAPDMKKTMSGTLRLINLNRQDGRKVRRVKLPRAALKRADEDEIPETKSRSNSIVEIRPATPAASPAPIVLNQVSSGSSVDIQSIESRARSESQARDDFRAQLEAVRSSAKDAEALHAHEVFRLQDQLESAKSSSTHMERDLHKIKTGLCYIAAMCVMSAIVAIIAAVTKQPVAAYTSAGFSFAPLLAAAFAAIRF